MTPIRVVAVLLAAGVALVAAELVAGGGAPKIADPCAHRAPFPGHGIDAAIQRIVLDGLDGAACRLGATREELVLSLGPGTSGRKLRWSKHTIEVAIRAGLLQQIDAAERRGDVPGFLAPVLRRIVKSAPIEQLVAGGIKLSDLFG